MKTFESGTAMGNLIRCGLRLERDGKIYLADNTPCTERPAVFESVGDAAVAAAVLGGKPRRESGVWVVRFAK